MIIYILRRLLQVVPTLAGVMVVVFLLIRVSGDPTQLLLPPNATPADRALFRKQHGLDQPLAVQFVRYVDSLAHGDLGRSLVDQRPAADVVFERLPATVELAVSGMAIAVVVGIPAGIASAVWRGSALDRLAMASALVGQSMATFWVGILLMLVFAVQLRWLPVSGRGGVRHLMLPAVTLSLYIMPVLARMTRSSMLEVWEQDFIRTARAKGLRERAVIVRHSLRAALIPVATVLGLQFGGALAGAIVTESVFSWGGVGTLVLDAIYKRDYPVVQAVVLVIAVMFMLVNLLVDVGYVVLDPRIRQT
ncbi:MAG TPA: ABC transporter permease [bacterium]|nr:ABC transporter permease [bacterium]